MHLQLVVLQVDTPSSSSNIEFITISTTGNSQDFGNLIAGSIREALQHLILQEVFIIKYDGNAAINTNQFVTIATTGNAVDFGDHF